MRILQNKDNINGNHWKHLNSETLKMKSLNTYNCGWCGLNFKQYVGKNEKYHEAGATMIKKSCISDQVQCPQCKNFIPTWK